MAQNVPRRVVPTVSGRALDKGPTFSAMRVVQLLTALCALGLACYVGWRLPRSRAPAGAGTEPPTVVEEQKPEPAWRGPIIFPVLQPVSSAPQSPTAVIATPTENAVPTHPTGSPEAEHARIIDAIKRSGADAVTPRVVSANNALRDIADNLARERFAEITQVECYRAGCVGHVKFADDTSIIRDRTRVLRAAKERWAGSAILTGSDPSYAGLGFAALVLETSDQ